MTDRHETPPPFRVTGHLGIEGDQYRERVTVTAEWNGRRLSIVGNRGQNIESVTAARPFPHDGRTDADRARIRAIWERWHLNDMRPGCEHQERGRRLFSDGHQHPTGRPQANLPTGTPCRVCGYRYGSAWNYEPVPPAVLREIAALLDDDAYKLPAPEPDDLDDEPEEFPHGDRVDSRELIGRTFGPAIDAEIAEAEGYSADWNYGATLIAAHDFENYAREFAEDIGAISDDARWPCDCIDWERAARELAQDWTTVEIDGTDYMVRG